MFSFPSFPSSDNCNEVNFPTSGCEFFFSIPYIHRLTTPARVLVSTSSNDTVTVNLTVPGMGANFTESHNITRYQHVEISISPEVRLDPGDGVQNNTIVLTSSDIVSVYAMDNEISKGEGFLVLPTSQLGNEYYVASYIPNGDSGFICVSAFEEETLVSIITKSGRQHHVILQAFQSYRFDSDDGEDLTATLVQSDHPVAVVSGGTSAIPVGVKNIDGLVEQLPPVTKWGREHYLSPFLGIFSGFIYRVISADENTTLSISNVGTVELPANSFYEANITDDIVIAIVSDKPVLVVQYMKGSYADPENIKRGDPSMVFVPSTEAYVNSVSFAIMDTSFGFDYHIRVTIDCDDIDGLIFDDTTSIADWNKVRSGSEPGSICSIRGRIKRGSGVHSVVHVDPSRRFSVIVYAISLTCCTSYSYVAGAGLPYTPIIPGVISTTVKTSTDLPTTPGTTSPPVIFKEGKLL